MAARSPMLLLASALLIGAIAIQVTGMVCAARIAESGAKAAQARAGGVPEEKITQLRDDADWWLSCYNMLAVVGILSAVAGTVSWVSAIVRKERGWRLVPAALLVAYLLLYLVLV